MRADTIIVATLAFIAAAIFASANQFTSGKFGLTSGSGTANRLAKFSNSSSLADSLLSDDDTNVTLTSGQFLAPDGTAALPSYAYSDDTNTGVYSRIADGITFSIGGSDRAEVSLFGLVISSGVNLAWGSSGLSSADIVLSRAAANVLQLASGDSFAFGGITTSFPRLKNSGSDLQVRLGDDSGYAAIDAGSFKISGSAVKTVVTFPGEIIDPVDTGIQERACSAHAVTGIVDELATFCAPRFIPADADCTYSHCFASATDEVTICWAGLDPLSACATENGTYDIMQPVS